MLHLVTAIIKPHRLENVKEALTEAGVAGMTISEVRGFGRQGGHTETYRGTEYQIDFVPKVRIEILAEAEDTEAIVDLIAITARTGRIGDGKIWVVPVEDVVRVRTGDHGRGAL